MLNKTQKINLFINVPIVSFKADHIEFKSTMAAQNQIILPFFVCRFVYALSSSDRFLLCPRSTQNALLEVIILVWVTGESRRRLYEASTVLGWWYSLTIWPKILAQRYDKITLFLNHSCNNTFYTQNVGHNFMDRLIRYVNL